MLKGLFTYNYLYTMDNNQLAKLIKGTTVDLLCCNILGMICLMTSLRGNYTSLNLFGKNYIFYVNYFYVPVTAFAYFAILKRYA